MPSSRIQNDFELFSHLIFTDLGRNSNNYDERSHQMADEPMPMVNGELERQDQETDERKVSSQIFYWSDRELGHGNSTVYEGEFTTLSREVIGCAVKRIIKATGPLRKQNIKEVMEEIKIWIELTKCASEGNNKMSSVVQCFGYTENVDFW